MKILITGASGMLGYDLWSALGGSAEHDLFGLGRGDCPEFIHNKQNWLKLDLTDPATTYQGITKVNPELVIHTAALTDVDFCELNPEKAYLTNTLGTRNITLACQRFDAAMLYISTDYVFAGEKPADSAGYREDDQPNPINTYGKTKYGGEFYLRHLLNKFYIVRTAWLFGKRRKNFISEIVSRCNIGENSAKSAELKVVADQVGSPTYTKDLAQALSQLIKKNLYGVYHLTNQGGCSRFELAQEIINLLDSKSKLNPLSQRELNRPALRPKYSVLENYNWQIQGFQPLRNWKEALREYLLV